MVRSPPPPAINSSVAAACMNSTPKVSDLPLRNVQSETEAVNPAQVDLPPSPPQSEPRGSSPIPVTKAGNLASVAEAGYPGTPSSTVVEFGDEGSHHFRSALEMAETVSQSSRSQSRSRSGTSESRTTRESRETQSNASTPRATDRHASKSRSRSSTRSHTSLSSQATQAKDRRGEDPRVRERVHKFLNSMAQQPPSDPHSELLAENLGLHQRVAALQRTERDLLKDNQDLSARLKSVTQSYDSRRRQWKEDVMKMENAYEDRIRKLEEKLSKQEEQIVQLGFGQPNKALPILDEEIVSWFDRRGESWQSWSEDYAHRDPTRLQSGLHPLQMLELCEGLKGFVCLTETNDLPLDLLNSPALHGCKLAQVLLHAMLCNFIIKETLESPLWVFTILSGNGLELESPSLPRANSMSPVGFRMDLALWNNVAPLRSACLPKPMTAARPHQNFASRNPPPLITTNSRSISLSLHTTGLSNIGDSGIPNKNGMENLFNLLERVQQQDKDSQDCLSQLIRVLAEGGMGLAPEEARGEDRRVLVEARQTFASRLKDRFLSGPARFLLEDQDAVGIMKLERRLFDEFDMALRFACRVWSRPEQLKFKNLDDLAGLKFHSSSPLMTLCKAQVPLEPVFPDAEGEAPPDYYDGQPLMIVVQPAAESTRNERALVQGATVHKQVTTNWSKARVVVSTPNLVPLPLQLFDSSDRGSSPSQGPSSSSAAGGSSSTQTGSSSTQTGSSMSSAASSATATRDGANSTTQPSTTRAVAPSSGRSVNLPPPKSPPRTALPPVPPKDNPHALPRDAASRLLFTVASLALTASR